MKPTFTCNAGRLRHVVASLDPAQIPADLASSAMLDARDGIVTITARLWTLIISFTLPATVDVPGTAHIGQPDVLQRLLALTNVDEDVVTIDADALRGKTRVDEDLAAIEADNRVELMRRSATAPLSAQVDGKRFADALDRTAKGVGHDANLLATGALLRVVPNAALTLTLGNRMRMASSHLAAEPIRHDRGTKVGVRLNSALPSLLMAHCTSQERVDIGWQHTGKVTRMWLTSGPLQIVDWSLANLRDQLTLDLWKRDGASGEPIDRRTILATRADDATVDPLGAHLNTDHLRAALASFDHDELTMRLDHVDGFATFTDPAQPSYATALRTDVAAWSG